MVLKVKNYEFKKNSILIALEDTESCAIEDVMTSPHFDVMLAEDRLKAKQLIESHDFYS